MYLPGTNQGHGHVWARPDGVRARCGGPGLCLQCKSDLQDKERASNLSGASGIDSHLIDVIVGDTYEHRKGGRYVVVALARIEIDLSPVVVYRAEHDGTVWVRPLEQFADGRFKHVN